MKTFEETVQNEIGILVLQLWKLNHQLEQLGAENAALKAQLPPPAAE